MAGQRLIIAVMGLSLLVSGCAARKGALPGSSGAAGEAVPELQKAIDAVYPALVRVEVVVPFYRDGREIRVESGGSGVIISPDGFVVTNHHVAGRATSIVCVLANKEEVPAERVGTDALTDICVLKLTRPGSYRCASFGDSDGLKVGDTVLAMGSPGSISQSVTAGIVSNNDLILPWFAGELLIDGEDVGALVKWIAHDAAIFPGNSGGPLANLDGEIVGINELGLGLGAAIPGNLARTVAAELIRSGAVRRSWLGVNIQPLLKSGGRTSGVLVGGVFPGSPAQESGLEPGDIILSYGGERVNARFGEDLPVFNRLVCASAVGSSVELEIERGGERKTIEITTRARSEAVARRREIKEWGMVALDLTEMMARAMKRKDNLGVLADTVQPGGPCSEAKPSVQGSDVIIRFNGKPVNNVDELLKETEAWVKDKTEPVPALVVFERRNEQWLTLVKVGVKKTTDQSPEARRAWLPASHQVLTAELAEALGLVGASGVRLTDVFDGRSAAQAGLKVGDIITAIDGDRVRAFRPEDADVFPAMVRQRNVGQEVKLTVLRDGREMTMPVKLERNPRAAREMKRHQDADFGFGARDLSEEDRRSMKLEEQVSGPLITEVEPGSLAAVAGLGVADVLLSVNGRPVPDVASLKDIMTEVSNTKPPRVVFFVRRGINTAFIEAETPWLERK